MRLSRAFGAVAAAVALTATVPGAAWAATAHHPAPSACRPADHLARITPDHPSAGHLHVRVTLTAPRGYESCTLAGSPVDLVFSEHGRRVHVTAGHYGDQHHPVVFGPGRPVHFDIQVPNQGHDVRADEASFTLRTPHGVVPGASVAEGRFAVSPGTLVGPVLPGA